jgi:hypothetical protein
VPSFLILRTEGEWLTAECPVSPETERIVTRWRDQEQRLQRREKSARLRRLSTSLDRANPFIFALASALASDLDGVYGGRQERYTAHSAIMNSWLESASLDALSRLSESWLRHRRTDAKTEEVHVGDEFAWRLARTDRSGLNFREAYRVNMGAAMPTMIDLPCQQKIK